jgi:tripartite-type tricarboxylate transporter receptor subunit TctC
MFRRSVLMLSVALTTGSVTAQTYPSKPIRLVVPFPAGGATDVLARALSVKLGEALGLNVVVDNKPGAGGSIGSDIVAKASADGYTLLLATSSTHSIGPALNAKLPYNAQTDFTPLGLVGTSPNIVLVPTTSSAKTLKDFIDMAKARPGQLNYASSGNGTIVHLSTELFKSQSGTFITHIPYRGTALAIPDLMSGKVDVLFDSLVSGLPHVKDGKLRALAVTSPARTPLAPDLAPVSDTLKGYESVTWFGLYAPATLPVDITAKVNAALNTALASTDVKERFARLGAEIGSGSADQFDRTVQTDAAKWRSIIAQRKITTD